MRNLKKILALVLALVLSLSLVTIASGADFNDADEITLTEAVDVMTTIGVLEGHNTGDFAPQGTLTREQAAKIITYMLLGENADKLSVGSSRYSDVAVTRWSAPAIEYCATLGIVAGNGDDTFNPAGTLTGYAFAKMLLTALGYKAETEGFTGSSWTINVARYALEVGLGKNMGGITWGATLTREQAAQMALNAIKAPLVAYKDGATIIINGEKVSFGSGDAYYVTTTLAKEQRISKAQLSNSKEYTVEFGEKYFPKLVLNTDETDAFGRPVYTWSYDKEDIGTYVNTELLLASYTTSVKGGEIYSDIGSVASDYDLTYYVDGVTLSTTDTKAEAAKLAKKNDQNMYKSGKGVLTEVYADSDSEELSIVVINTYLAQAVSDYSKTTEKLTVRIYNAYSTSITRTLSNDDFDVADYKKDDVMLVTMAGSNPAVETVAAPEVVSNVSISTYSVDKDTAESGKYKLGSVTADGTKYSTAAKAFWDSAFLYDYNSNTQQLKDYTYNLYLDPYGYVVGVQNVEDTANYLFIAGYDVGSSVLAKTLDKALVIFPDGKMQTVTCYEKDGVADVAARDNSHVNAWYSYTVDKDGYYVINGKVADQFHDLDTGRVLDTQNPTLKGVKSGTVGDTIAYGNSESIYITVTADKSVDKTDGSIVDVTNITTGIRNTSIDMTENFVNPGGYGAYVMFDGNYVKYAVVVGEDGSVGSRFVYLTDGIAERSWAEDPGYYWSYDAVVNGELVTTENGKGGFNTLIEKDTNGNWLQGGALYKASYDANGYAKKMELMSDNWTTATTDNNKDNGYVQITSSGNTAFSATLRGQTIYFNTANYSKQYVMTDNDCVFYVQNTDTSTGKDYVRYDDIDAAMAATGAVTNETYYITGRMIAICDKTTGFAKTIIISDSKFENKNDNPGPIGPNTKTFNSVSATLNNATGSVEVKSACSDISGWNVHNASAKYSVTGNGKTYSFSDNNVSFSGNTFTTTAIPGLVVNAAGEYTVDVVVTFTGDAGETWTITGSTSFIKF